MNGSSNPESFVLYGISGPFSPPAGLPIVPHKPNPKDVTWHGVFGLAVLR